MKIRDKRNKKEKPIEVFCKMSWIRNRNEYLYLVKHPHGGAGSIYLDKVIWLHPSINAHTEVGRKYTWLGSSQYEECEFETNEEALALLEMEE